MTSDFKEVDRPPFERFQRRQDTPLVTAVLKTFESGKAVWIRPNGKPLQPLMAKIQVATNLRLRTQQLAKQRICRVRTTDEGGYAWVESRRER